MPADRIDDSHMGEIWPAAQPAANSDLYGTESQQVAEAMMGDIVQTDDRTVDVSVEAVSHTPIERIEILNGSEVIKTLGIFNCGK